MLRYYGTCRYTQTRYWTSPYRLGSRPTGVYMTTTPSHHSVVHQNCLLKGQAMGMSRGFHGRKFTKRRGIVVTHLILGLRGRLLQCKRETFLVFTQRWPSWIRKTVRGVGRANEGEQGEPDKGEGRVLPNQVDIHGLGLLGWNRAE